jgi:hypothetical protein
MKSIVVMAWSVRSFLEAAKASVSRGSRIVLLRTRFVLARASRRRSVVVICSVRSCLVATKANALSYSPLV